MLGGQQSEEILFRFLEIWWGWYFYQMPERKKGMKTVKLFG